LKKEMIITLIITILIGGFMCLYGLAVLFGLISTKVNYGIVLIVFLLGIGLVAALIYTCIERVKEIKEEDKDDISKY
jgi:hypothetical protein